MKTLGYLALIPMMIFGIRAYSQPGYYPPPANVIYHNDTLTICPPDSLPGEPVVLLAYNILVDSVFFDNLPVTDPTDTLDYIFTFPALPPGAHSFCVNAVYNQWISDQACDSATVIYGYELPFLEDWSSGSFEELQWTSSSGNWVISEEEGNPAPAVEFRGNPAQSNYSINLESYPINALGTTVGILWLDFYLKLDDSQSTGNEKMRIQVWNCETCAWTTVAECKNNQGSHTWSEHINIKAQAANKIFRLRFQATGVNSNDIQSWFIDNIHVYRMCASASELDLEEHTNYNQLNWMGPTGCYPPNWMRWDDGVNSGNSIGTGGAIEFDVAARWEPEQLVDFENFPVSEIAFFPAEPSATYSIRIWSGVSEDSLQLIVDQPVENPQIGRWNTITLTDTYILDNTREFWVGYHVDTPTGYPAGVDDGPAIDGYGNMMYFEGTWQTLLEINPDLDYNWNIAVRIGPDHEEPDIHFCIYRSTNDGEFLYYDKIADWGYTDPNIILEDYYCYEVTVEWILNGDTCESAPTNTVCESVNIGIDQHNQDQLIKIYPNPAKNWLNIESEVEIRNIRIYNLLGDEILKLEIGNLEDQVDVSQLQSGIYYVNVTTIGSEFKEKIVILR